MCHPLALGGLSLLSSIMSSRAEAKQMEQQAKLIDQRAAFDTARMKMEQDEAIGDARARAAAGGGLVDAGGNLDMQTELAADYGTARALRQWEGDFESSQLRGAAKSTRQAGIVNGLTGAASSYLGSTQGKNFMKGLI